MSLFLSEDGQINDACQERILNHLRLNFQPTKDPTRCHMHMTTNEMYMKLQGLYPGDYKPEHVSEWLEQLGFKYYDFGVMRYEWIMNKAVY